MNKYEKQQIAGTVKLPSDRAVLRNHPHNNFNIYLISDLHCGAVECNYELLHKAVKEISSDKNSLVIVGGDTIEGIPRGYKINEEGQHCGIDQQIARTAKALRPIAKQCVVMFKGNHNTKSRGESTDSDLMIAELLDVPYKTVPSVIMIKTKKGVVKLAGGHGSRSSKNQDIEIQDMRVIFPGCQAYFLGHTHALFCKQIGALTHTSSGAEKWDGTWFIRTGNFLNYAEYARYALYAPQRSGFVRLTVNNGIIVKGECLTKDNLK